MLFSLAAMSNIWYILNQQATTLLLNQAGLAHFLSLCGFSDSEHRTLYSISTRSALRMDAATLCKSANAVERSNRKSSNLTGLSPTSLLRQTLTGNAATPETTHPLWVTVEKTGLEADAPRGHSQKAVKSSTFLRVVSMLEELNVTYGRKISKSFISSQVLPSY